MISDNDNSPLPLALTIETHNLCNRKCWFCKFGNRTSQEPTNWMSWELITKIISNLREFNFSGRLSWYRINEPLLDKRIFEIIRLSRTQLPKSFLSLLTNGDLLTAEVLDRLYDSGINSVGVSIYDEESFRKFQNKAFERCVIIDRRPQKETTFVESRGGNIPLSSSSDWVLKNCLRPSSMMNVLSNGDVVLCCGDFYGEIRVGSLMKDRIEDVWVSPLLEKYRRTLEVSGRSQLALCSDCTYHGGKHDRDYPENKRLRTFPAIIS
jgi:GTP 3',8-cyclase